MTRPAALRAVLLALFVLAALPAVSSAADRDGMPDSWERRSGLSARANDARRDPDADGLTNIREYRAATKPRRRDTDGDAIPDGVDLRPRRRDGGPGARMRPARSRVLTDGEAAARVRRSGWEPRPQNRSFNRSVPTVYELAVFRARGSSWGRCEGLRRRITGAFRGTTDEIIQWAAWKWGVDEQLLRASAAHETWWKQNAVGNSGYAYGLLQVHRRHHPAAWLLASRSTAFNADYYTAHLRYHLDGCATWLNQMPRGERYRAGDLWGSLLAWCTGQWWRGCDGYLAVTRRYMAQRVWRGRWF